jgi:hypothetical protein
LPAEPDAIRYALGYAKFYGRSHDAVIRIYDNAGNVIETHEHADISKSDKRFAHTSLGCNDRPSSLRFDNHSSQGCGVA